MAKKIKWGDKNIVALVGLDEHDEPHIIGSLQDSIKMLQVYEDSDSGLPVTVKGDNGAARVTDGFQGIARTRWIDVVAATAPTVAGSGTITFTNPVFGVWVDSVILSSGTIALTANNWTIRCAVDAANDAAAAILLPTTFPSGDPTADGGQIMSFNVQPVWIPDTEAAGDLRVGQITLPRPVEIPVTRDGILRLDFAHNIATTTTIILGIRALEAV